MIDDCAAEMTLEADEPWSPSPDPPVEERPPRSRPQGGRRESGMTPLYCGDCGTTLPPDSTRGCCVNRDFRFDQMMPAEVMGALEWGELDGDEQALVVALINFPGGEAREAELRERLNWTCERLYAVAAPRARQAAEFSCCIYVQETFRLTDQGRDAFLALSKNS